MEPAAEQATARIAPVEKAPAVVLLDQIVKGYESPEGNIPSLIDNVAELVKIGKASGPNVSMLLREMGANSDVRLEIIERLTRDYQSGKQKEAQTDIEIACLLGIVTDSLPNTQKLVIHIEQEYERERLEQAARQKTRIHKGLGSRARTALAIGVLTIAASVPIASIGTIGPASAAIPETPKIMSVEPQNTAQATQDSIIETARTNPPKDQRILYPKELAYNEVLPWIGKLRNSHDAVLSETLFTKELAAMSSEQREKVMQSVAQTYAKVLVEHYGNSSAIIGIDPGHGGTEIGSSAKTQDGKILLEKDLTWQFAQMVSEAIYSKSNGRYFVIMLRPQNPTDLDLDKDGIISPIERLQKRKALLLQTEKLIREDSPERIGENIIYLSLHFNGSPDPLRQGAETIWPNDVAMNSQSHRTSSMKLAQKLQEESVNAIRKEGYPVNDLGAKEDSDKNETKGNSDPIFGPYLALGSNKLDRVLSISAR